MNHSFKKNIAFTFLTLGGILSLSSCKDSDMEVFVAQDTRNQKLIEAIKAIPERKKWLMKISKKIRITYT